MSINQSLGVLVIKKDKKDFNKELIKRFAIIYEFCERDIKKFILLLRQGVCPQEYIDSWETLINLCSYKEKLFVHKNIWIAGRDLMKHHYLRKRFL